MPEERGGTTIGRSAPAGPPDARGDRQALAEFVREHEPLIRARFRAAIESGSRGMFDSSDFFVSVARRADALMLQNMGKMPDDPGDGPDIRAMLREVLLSAAEDYARAVDDDDRVAAGAETGALPGSMKSLGTSSEAMTAALACADDVDRQIARLRAEGWKHGAIAPALGLSEPAIRMRWHRVVQRVAGLFSAKD